MPAGIGYGFLGQALQPRSFDRGLGEMMRRTQRYAEPTLIEEVRDTSADPAATAWAMAADPMMAIPGPWQLKRHAVDADSRMTNTMLATADPKVIPGDNSRANEMLSAMIAQQAMGQKDALARQDFGLRERSLGQDQQLIDLKRQELGLALGQTAQGNNPPPPADPFLGQDGPTIDQARSAMEIENARNLADRGMRVRGAFWNPLAKSTRWLAEDFSGLPEEGSQRAAFVDRLRTQLGEKKNSKLHQLLLEEARRIDRGDSPQDTNAAILINLLRSAQDAK